MLLFRDIVVLTCIANEGDTKGHDGIHEHPQLQLFVSEQKYGDEKFIS